MAVAHHISVRAVQGDEELHLANDLMAKSQAQNYFRSRDWIENTGLQYPGFRREHTRLALYNGELAGALRLHTDTIRLGEARLKMGGFAWVSTNARHRHKGVARALISDTLEYMRGHGYHVAMLFGIPNFYHRFGFVTTLADYAVVVDTLEACREKPANGRTRTVKPGDIKTVQKIHSDGEKDVACSLVRTAAHMTNRWDWWKDAQVVMNAKGRVEGYYLARIRKRAYEVIEVGAENAGAANEIVAHCGREAMREGLGQIRFLVPAAHPFAHRLLLRDSTHEMKVVHGEGGMMAFVNLPECLENVIPEWESELERLSLHAGRTEVTLVVDRQPYRVRANYGAFDITPQAGKNKVGMTSAELMHLLTGYRHLPEFLDSTRRIIDADGHTLLSALFPKRDSYVWALDRF